MQRTIDATRRAERNVARRLDRFDLIDRRKELSEARKQSLRFRGEIRNLVRDERVRRREDWECGPRLQPKRDIGVNANRYGALERFMFSPPRLPKHDPRKKTPVVDVGDRIFLLEGRDRGKIGEIKRVDEDTQTAIIENLNYAELSLDKAMQAETKIQDDSSGYPLALPLNKVQLVYPIQDPKTGSFKDAIISDLALRDVPNEKTLRFRPLTKPIRYITGTNMIIPWPTLTPPAAEKSNPDDTARLNVDKESHSRPVLLSAPMPTSVIDELRNKYSRFRTRHEASWIAHKETEIKMREERDRILTRLVKTPLQEFHEKRLADKEAMRPKALTRRQLAAIGEAVAKERAESGKMA